MPSWGIVFLVNFRILLLRFWSWAHFSDYLFIMFIFFFIVSWFLLSVRRAEIIFDFKKAFPSSNLRCIGWFGSQKVWDHAAREGLLSFSLVFFWAWNQRLTRQSSARCAAANFAVVRALESYKLRIFYVFVCSSGLLSPSPRKKQVLVKRLATVNKHKKSNTSVISLAYTILPSGDRGDQPRTLHSILFVQNL